MFVWVCVWGVCGVCGCVWGWVGVCVVCVWGVWGGGGGVCVCFKVIATVMFGLREK